MKKISLLAVLLVVPTGMAVMLQRSTASASARAYLDTELANNAAFRDGLYLGRLAAERGSGTHMASGRWAKEADRDSFKAGFRQGYNQALASR
jgi:hypothetical protein